MVEPGRGRKGRKCSGKIGNCVCTIFYSEEVFRMVGGLKTLNTGGLSTPILLCSELASQWDCRQESHCKQKSEHRPPPSESGQAARSGERWNIAALPSRS
jgi:hypothetical protein